LKVVSECYDDSEHKLISNIERGINRHQ